MALAQKSINTTPDRLPKRLNGMAPADDKPQSPEVQQFRIDRLERDLSELVKTTKALADLVKAQEVRREADRENRAAERREDQAHRADVSLTWQQAALIVTAILALTGIVLPWAQASLTGG